ncbi:hypothetical protein ABIC89_000849 [Variovorax boronicumulans]|uniref:hypothetical protein n=1 Tax=Variovorax boronicumulans TaxID=436515 RepID=UPI00339879B8
MKTPGNDLSTLQAKAALNGFQVKRTLAGNIVISRNAGAWIFGTLAEAAHWLSLSIGEVPKGQPA